MKQDDRLGFATHFDQLSANPAWNPQWLTPLIATMPGAWIRDDIGWSALENVAKGSYGAGWFASAKIPWMQAAKNAGLKIVGCVQAGGPYSPPSSWYADAFDVAGYSAAVAWLAGQGLVDVIEVLNEFNNNPFRSYGGATWREKYVALFEATYSAVKAVSNVPVIGFGAQGSDILYMLGLTTKGDGVVSHSYDDASGIPERVYEPSYTDYETWVKALRAKTSLPIWETERNDDNNKGEYHSAIWNARRLIMSLGLGVEHTFVYDFLDSDTAQSVVDYYDYARQNYFVINRLFGVLGNLTTTKHGVTITNEQTGFNIADFKSYVFTVQGGQTVAAVWFGNKAPAKLPQAIPPQSCSVNFSLQHSHVFNESYILDTITGATQPILEPGLSNPNGAPQWGSFYGPVNNVLVSERPQLIVVK